MRGSADDSGRGSDDKRRKRPSANGHGLILLESCAAGISLIEANNIHRNGGCDGMGFATRRVLAMGWTNRSSGHPLATVQDGM